MVFSLKLLSKAYVHVTILVGERFSRNLGN